MRLLLLVPALVVTAAGTAACPGPDPDPPDDAQRVTLAFRATVGDEVFACGQQYAGIGTTSSSFEAGDLRVYLSNIKLHASGGGDVAAAIVDEDPWQARGTALLDFEDATGKCSSGTTDTRTTVSVTVPQGTGAVDGVTFDLGVPDEHNHEDITSAPSPLNLSSMFWGWAAGFRFLKLDTFTTGQPNGWLVHVGSAGCEVGAGGVFESCQHVNRPTVTLDGWNEDKVIVLDLKALLEGADIDDNTDDTAPGCMSEPADPDCEAPFGSLGIPFGDGAAPAQTVFRVEDGA